MNTTGSGEKQGKISDDCFDRKYPYLLSSMVPVEKSLKEVAEFLGGKLIGDPSEKVSRPAEIRGAKKGSISFLSSPKYERFIEDCEATCLVVEHGFYQRRKKEIDEGKIKVKNFIEVENPLLCMLRFLSLFEYKISFPDGAENLSFIASSAKLGRDVAVFPFCYVGAGAEIGDGSILMPGVFIGDNSKIGKRVLIFPNAVLYPYSEVGDDTVIHAGAVIGADGFGYISFFGEIKKIPQVGVVRIGKNVEIGANSCVDRATLEATEVSDDVKIDNLVQVAHNVKIGRGTRIASLTGIAGSSHVGEFCVFGGQVGVSDHVEVGDFVLAGARTAIISKVESGKVVMGEPAMERPKFLKVHGLYLKLPEIWERIKKLEREIKELKKEKKE